jgi:hypothetical protein
MVVLHRIRHGTVQTPVVQQVNIAGGGQAIVAGNLSPSASDAARE